MRSYRLVALGLLVAGIGMVPAPPAAPGAADPSDIPAPELAGRLTPSARTTAAGSAAAQEIAGLAQEVSMSYEVDASAVATNVNVSATLTNTTSDRVFLSYGIPAPTEAADVSARTAGGTPMSVSAETVPEAEQMKRIDVSLGPGLEPGQAMTIRLSYHLGSQSPRASTLSQANKALFMFPVLPLGDSGRSSIEVRIPASYEVEVVGSDLDRREDGREVVLSADGIADSRDFFAVVLATDESQLVSETIEVAGTEVDVQAWPGDAEWIEFVAGNVEAGVEVLEDLIGEPWPNGEILTVVETMTPVAQGYGGWYDPGEHTIRIGNELDAHLVLHELSHVWINFDMFEERWLLEGFAEEYAYRTMEELGRPRNHPRPGPAAVENRPFPLTEWTTPSFSEHSDDGDERYGYTASWHVVGTIAEEVGTDALRDVVEVAAEGALTYRGASEPEPSAAPMDWRRLLDLFENVGGSQRAAGLFDAYVVSPAERDELAARSAARTSYQELVREGDEWAPPYQVRQHMTEWDFDAATSAIAGAEAVLDLREEITDVLDRSDVRSLGLEMDYERAADVEDLLSRAESTLAAAHAYVGAERREAEGTSNPLETIGLWWADTDGRLDAARLALEEGDPGTSLRASRSVVGRLDDAGRDGALRLGGATLLAGAGVAVATSRRRQRHRAPGPFPGPPAPGPMPWPEPPRPASVPEDRSAGLGLNG